MQSVGRTFRSEVDELVKWFRDWHAPLLKAQHFDGKIRGHKEDVLPTSCDWPEEQSYLARLAAARTNTDFMLIRNELRDKQKSLARRKRSTMTQDQKRWWLLHSHQYANKSASEAAADLDLQDSTVTKWRAEYKYANRPATHKGPAPRDCEGCGEPFTPKRSHARTCSDRCRKRLQRPQRVAA
jgi:hypothetical protein